MIRLRFVRGNSLTSSLIVLREQTAMPFTPSHVECVTPDGKWLGQHVDGGMQAREAGYDAGEVATLPDGRPCELFVELPASAEQTDHFYSYAKRSIGQPYDWQAILGFVVDWHEHQAQHAICSAKILLLLRGCGFLKWPVAVPAHLVTPRDLLLMLSVMVEVPH